MVPVLTIIFMIISLIIAVGLPLFLGIKFVRKSKTNIRPILAGLASFFVLQVVIRIPILQFVMPNIPFYKELGAIGLSIFLGLTAGLFETIGRYLSIKFLVKENRSYETGIAHGVGHGGIEAVMLLGLTYLNYLIYVFMINAGTFMSTLAPAGTDPAIIEQLQLVKDLLVDTESWMFLLSGYERIAVLFIHIGLSLLIMEGFMKNKILKYSLIALLIHSLLDGLVVYMGTQEVNVFIIEGFVTLVSIGLITYIVKSRKRLKT